MPPAYSKHLHHCQRINITGAGVEWKRTDYAPRLVRLRQHVPMHRPTIPNDEVAWVDTHFDLLGTSLFEPRNLLGIKAVPIIRHSAPFGFLLHAMSLEESLGQLLRALQHHKAAVLWSIRREVDDALGALQTLQVRILVHVRPGCRGQPLALRKRQSVIDAIERGQQLLRTPDPLKGF